MWLKFRSESSQRQNTEGSQPVRANQLQASRGSVSASSSQALVAALPLSEAATFGRSQYAMLTRRELSQLDSNERCGDAAKSFHEKAGP